MADVVKYKLADRLSLIEESSTIKMSKISRELKEKGIDIINLSLGEPDFDTPEHIKSGAIAGINNNFTHYPPVSGYLDLRKAVAEKFKRDNNLDYQAENIVVSNGAKQSLMNVILALVNPGDEVVLPTPYWVSYPEMVKFAEGIPVFIHTDFEANFKVNPNQLREVLNSKTKVFVFSSPSNPSGAIYTESELRALAEVFKDFPDIIIISDEIYELINFIGAHFSIAQIPELFNRVVVINGVSKAFAMTGWRIGYMAAPLEIAKACDKIQSQFTSAASSIAQRATLTAITTSYEPTYEMRDAFKHRRDVVVNSLRGTPGLNFNVPDGAFYLFPEVSYYYGKSFNDKIIHNGEDLCMFLLEDARVSLVAGTGFGSKNYIRISFAASEQDLIEACNRIKTSLAKLY